jgi:GNAT superfamily N-acetyltransferase
MAVVIDAATQADIPALATLLQTLFTQESEFAPDAARQWRGLEMILARPGLGQIFIARDGVEVTGMINLLFTVSTALGEPVCWLEDMVVRPDKRGAGLGGQLIEHAIGYAEANGYARVTLLTDGVNADARRFYARHGFRQSDMVVMRKLFS